ncbi:Metallo-dependent phosphatase [Glarea lozoyensis ATCC 20868]|uniref:Metallo-dependent phosphatase n=1 Tax=Glarea lozoyensis (strain ATCC 20868 / MF5171) TaxID=1116229 RepID=S3DWN2_GLAL2|nr:Metallo-dependent phosphatase [Glarea lozoyensis ATCC 20868]EPE36336.1 Metallo-dependent phosphatase [Glarea lozoyensis ATCC 20868]
MYQDPGGTNNSIRSDFWIPTHPLQLLQSPLDKRNGHLFLTTIRNTLLLPSFLSFISFFQIVTPDCYDADDRNINSSTTAPDLICNAHGLQPAATPAGAIGGPGKFTPPTTSIETIAWPLPPHNRYHGNARSLILCDANDIPDLHPDIHYKPRSSTDEEDACHRGKGPAGFYGAETSDCDSPYSLVNATFKWIEENVKDTIDFVIWTGDSARHDSDEDIPRNQDEVLDTNRWVAKLFADTFKADAGSEKALSIPIVSTFGNNDILPHNILLSGPNKWLKSYTDIWSKFIPEEQRHGFERGGWYFVEVIPNKLAVFSLNTLYFFKNNAGVDGCTLRSEPGFEHFEWLRIQLQFLRERGMKVMLMGHVPPARTDSKALWDETCWQKYTLWLRQYRDIIVGGLYGHMNIDHFMLQDTKQITILGDEGASTADEDRDIMDDELSIESANDYLEELRQNWSDLPNPASALKDPKSVKHSGKSKKGKGKKGKGGKGKKSKKDKLLDKIGGPWGERFHVTNVGPSVVPNYFPTIRIVEYNITGLDGVTLWADTKVISKDTTEADWLDEEAPLDVMDSDEEIEEELENDEETTSQDLDDEETSSKHKKKKSKHGKKKRKHGKKPTDPNLTVPQAPTKGTPPGPAYSPQSLTLLGYTQYFANLTAINNMTLVESDDDEIDEEKWRKGKHEGKHPKNKVPHPKPFAFEIEYSTFNDTVFKLRDMTVRSYIRLAHRIGQYRPGKGDSIEDVEGQGEDLEWSDEIGDEEPSDDEDEMNESDEHNEAEDEDEDDSDDAEDDDVETDKHKKKHHKKKHHKKKHHHRNEKNKVWLTFIQRAFVGTLGKDELESFDGVGDVDEVVGDGRHSGEL